MASAAEWDRLKETMTLPRYYRIQDQWSDAPPVRRLLAAVHIDSRKRRRRGPAGRASHSASGEPVGGFEDFVRAFAPHGKAAVIR